MSDISNYTPISLATIIAKVRDSLLDKHLEHISISMIRSLALCRSSAEAVLFVSQAKKEISTLLKYWYFNQRNTLKWEMRILKYMGWSAA